LFIGSAGVGCRTIGRSGWGWQGAKQRVTLNASQRLGAGSNPRLAFVDCQVMNAVGQVANLPIQAGFGQAANLLHDA
jgi:hypothetical protein